MLKGCMEIFGKLYEKHGERLILDTYSPKNGTYRLIRFDGEKFELLHTVEVKTDKKAGETGADCDSETYYSLKFYDYYSKLLSMNKPVDPKKVIHSNNYLAFAVKKVSIAEGKLTADIIRQYFEILADPTLKYKKKETKRLYLDFEETYGAPDRDLIEKIKDYVLTGQGWEDIDTDKNDYLKIFFVLPDQETTMELYRKEGSRYTQPNLYNNNDFNRVENGNIVGLSNDNMGMNSKKPYLANKTRKVQEPYLLTRREADLQGKFFDYLYGNVVKGRPNVYLSDLSGNEQIYFYTDTEQPGYMESGYYLRVGIGQAGAEIESFQNITSYSTKLSRSFVLKDCIGSSSETLEKSTLPYGEKKEELWQVKDLIDNIFFRGKLKTNFFTEEKDISEKETAVKRAIMEARHTLHGWFYEGHLGTTPEVLERVSWNLIRHSLIGAETADIYGARRQCNLRWSLMDYFHNDERMENLMGKVRTMLREHLRQDGEWEFADDLEYSYAVGQLASYFVSRSRSSNKTASLVNPFLNTESVEYIQTRLQQLYKKYNYDIPHYAGSRVNKLLSRVMEAKTESIKLDKELILAGFTAESLIYEKTEKTAETEGGTDHE